MPVRIPRNIVAVASSGKVHSGFTAPCWLVAATAAACWPVAATRRLVVALVVAVHIAIAADQVEL